MRCNPPSEVTVSHTVRQAIGEAQRALIDQAWLELPREKGGKPYPPFLLFSPSITTRQLLSFGIPGMATTTFVRKRKHDVLEERRTKGGKRYWVISATYKGCSFFANTSKMSCPSWSVPAGHPSIGGTCAAAGAMLTSPPNVQRATTRQLELATGQEVRGGGAPFVCDYCYAGKANYANSSTQFWQALRHGWFVRAMAYGPDELVRQLVAGIEHEVAYLRAFHGKRRQKNPLDRAGRRLPVKHSVWAGVDPRYFRIYDSGDFHSPAAVEAWCEVARRLPRVTFWAPTRMWWAKAWANEFRRAPSNLLIRPSGLHFTDPAPRVPGLAAGTGVSAGDKTVWTCPVYTGKARTCAKAHGPKALKGGRLVAGKAPCRVCWGEGQPKRLPWADVDVSYTAH